MPLGNRELPGGTPVTINKSDCLAALGQRLARPDACPGHSVDKPEQAWTAQLT